MGQAKLKQRMAFSPQLIAQWEADDCVNFAIALARLTGWLLHVDWGTPSREQNIGAPMELLKPLRVYVADNYDLIFDVRGIRHIDEFNNKIIRELATRTRSASVSTRFYEESMLASLPLRAQPHEARIKLATEEILKNPHYVAGIPCRTPPFIPAYKAAHFTFGRCAAFAEAMSKFASLPPIGLIATRYSPQFSGTRPGYFHSVVMHPDGIAEDAWGKASLTAIARRFGAIEFTSSHIEHIRVIENLKRSSPDLYNSALDEATEIIQTHCGG